MVNVMDIKEIVEASVEYLKTAVYSIQDSTGYYVIKRWIFEEDGEEITADRCIDISKAKDDLSDREYYTVYVSFEDIDSDGDFYFTENLDTKELELLIKEIVEIPSKYDNLFVK